MDKNKLLEELGDVEDSISRVEAKIKNLGAENFKSPVFKILISEESELVKKKYRLERELLKIGKKEK